ncbi:MAG: VWA domain-containing protein [Bdellovibrionaceae bacterium]|nr:VWA domain-containing protein [Pseudobdellovibrionaceae bacterium]
MKPCVRSPDSLARQTTVALGLMCLALSAMACSPASPKLTAPAEVINAIPDGDGDFKVEFNPKVDILFVIDNSASMEDDQTRLSQNIDRFVSNFSENGLIDYHIGITTVSDRIRQKPGSPNYYPVGQLRPLKTPGQTPVVIERANCKTTDAIAGDAKNAAPDFVTRETPNGLEILRESLKVGVLCLDDGGPEYEELFTPVAAALSPEMRAGANRGFYREDALLVVILVSDASPSNLEITPSELALELRRLKNFNSAKISTHAIGIHPDYNCAVDPSLKGPNETQLYPTRIREFVRETDGRLLSLCPQLKKLGKNGKPLVDQVPWGDRLAEIGRDIRRRVIAREVRLKALPEYGTIQVTYGAQTITPDSPEKRGWRYNVQRNSLIIDGDVQLRPEPGAQIRIEYMPVNTNNFTNQRARHL